MRVVMQVLNPCTHDARVHKQASTLAAAGYEVLVLALHKGTLSEREHCGGYTIRRLRLWPEHATGGLFSPAFKYVQWMRGVAAASQGLGATVYHCHDANTLVSAVRPVRRDRARWIYDAHELETGRNFVGSRLAWCYRRIWAWPERLYIRGVNGVITSSPSYAEQMVERYGIEPPQIIINAPAAFAARRGNRLRTELGIPEDHRIVLYQGVVSAGRGLRVAVRALLQLPTDVELVILGKGAQRHELQELAASVGVAGRVHLPGAIPHDELLDFTASADIGLCLFQNTCESHYYSLPNKLLEYPMAGIPVVASDFPEMRRIVSSYDVGALVAEPHSASAAAEAIRGLLTDPERHRSMCANTQRLARELSWEHEADKLLAFYDRLGLSPT